MAFGDNIAQVTIAGNMHGQQTRNILHFASNGAVPPDNASSLAGLVADVIDCIRTTLLPALSVDWSLEFVSAKSLLPTASDEVRTDALGTDVGEISGDGDATFVAAKLQLRTGLAGKSHRGRMYVAGMPESAVQGSKLTAGEITLLIAFTACLLEKFVTNIPDPGYKLVVLSRRHNNAAVSLGPGAVTPVTTINVSQPVASMVSRKIGHGR